MSANEGELVDQVLTAMLWSRLAASVARTNLHVSAFAGRAALAALIDVHDQNETNSARDGMERVQSITRSIINRAAHVRRTHDVHDAWLRGTRTDLEPPSPYINPAVSMIAYRDGTPDPVLLVRARQVLTYLPQLVAPAGGRDSHSDISRLVAQLTALQACPAGHAGANSQRRGTSTRPRRAKPGRSVGSARSHHRPARISASNHLPSK
jgi:hypothetical protein